MTVKQPASFALARYILSTATGLYQALKFILRKISAASSTTLHYEDQTGHTQKGLVRFRFRSHPF